MDACVCTQRIRVCFLIKRAIRAVFGILLIGVLTSYIIGNVHDENQTALCNDVHREVQRLKSECVSRNQAQRKQPQVPCDKRHGEEGNGGPKMDALIRAMVRLELQSYAADKTGMADFALENLGACVISTRDTKLYKDNQSSFMGIDFWRQASDPNQILRPTSTVPGQCWAFFGSEGTAVIRLMAYVFITHVTLEHVNKWLTPSGEISSAPKTFSLWGLESDSEMRAVHKFGTFVYCNPGPTVQTFQVQHLGREFRVVEVVFENNHGNPLYTCVYRVRIHGKMDSSKKIN